MSNTYTSQDIAEARADLRDGCTCEYTPVGPDTYVRPVTDLDCLVHLAGSDDDETITRRQFRRVLRDQRLTVQLARALLTGTGVADQVFDVLRDGENPDDRPEIHEQENRS